MKNDLNEYCNKKIDNELKKKELAKKYGANFSQINDVPLDVESQWLESIERFEEHISKSVKISVYEHIQKPPYKLLSELESHEVSVELDRLFQLLNGSNIRLDTLCAVDDRELYRFITEELFLHETDTISMPGMTTCYIYEEFHPNSKLDIQQACDFFFDATMGKISKFGGSGYNLLYLDTEGYENADGVCIEKQQVVDRINNFLSSFDSFKIVNWEVKDLTINDEEQKAILNFYIRYLGLFDNEKDTIEFKGDGCFKLKSCKFGGWNIYHITMPGLKI